MIDPQMMQMLQQADGAQAQPGAQVNPNDPMQAMLVGAVASEMLKPKRVKNLEAFISQYPEVAQMIAQALGKQMPRFGVSEVGTLSGLANLFGGMNAKADSGPEQGLEQELE
jgi:hypothetical protein